MKIARFTGRKINGFLDFNLKFHDDLTFVTGINGTGKTSAINSIVALLFPRLDYLSAEQFDLISLEIEHKDEKVILSAVKEGQFTQLKCSKYPNEIVSIEPFDYGDSLPMHRAVEQEEEFFKDQLARNRSNPVMEFFEDLPSPMYLGLDRRSLSFDNMKSRFYGRPRPRNPYRRKVFSRSLGPSLEEALSFAQETDRENKMKESRIGSRFREKLVMALLDFPPIAFSGPLEDPTQAELNKIAEAKRNLRRLPKLLRVPADEISEKVDPIFEFLDGRIALLQGRGRSKKKNDDETRDYDGERMEALIEWSFNKAQLNRMNLVSEIVSEHNEEVEKLFKRTNEFLDTINSFLSDSGKKLSFGKFGELVFSLRDDEDERDIRTLSSGEIQLIVILAHLYFNPEVSQANVFIIDEPELSLHVQWQEKFVDGLIAASDKTQFIMATHSPSIILEKVKNCVEIPVR